MNYTTEQVQAMSVQELKALAYDQLAIIEHAQKNLEGLNQLIAQKSQQPLPVVEETKE